MSYYKGLIDRYREYLPVDEFTPIVTLNEGNTPLIKADNLAQKLELDADSDTFEEESRVSIVPGTLPVTEGTALEEAAKSAPTRPYPIASRHERRRSS